MSESRVEIENRGNAIDLPTELCCNCAREDGLSTVESELKLTRYFGMAGTEYTFKWELPYCAECRPTASRIPLNKMHIALMIGLWTVGLFLVVVIAQTAMDTSLFGGNDFWVALGFSTMLVCGFYGSRRPKGTQTSYYQPIRIRKLRQKFTSGEVTGIVLGFTSPSYVRRFRDANAAALAV